MKAYRESATIVLVSVALLGSLFERCHAEDPTFGQRTFVGEDFFVGFFPHATAWIGLQRSVDCVTWTDVASIATTNGVTEFVDVDARKSPCGFYRLRNPGLRVEDAQAKWSFRVSGDYRFQLQHIRQPDSPTVLSATVAVSGGQKVVTEAEADGQPLEPAEPSDFPSVEELFATLQQAQQAGCWRVAVTYDAATGYPTWCVIEKVDGPGAKHVDLYRITGLSVTTTGNGS